MPELAVGSHQEVAGVELVFLHGATHGCTHTLLERVESLVTRIVGHALDVLDVRGSQTMMPEGEALVHLALRFRARLASVLGTMKQVESARSVDRVATDVHHDLGQRPCSWAQCLYAVGACVVGHAAHQWATKYRSHSHDAQQGVTKYGSHQHDAQECATKNDGVPHSATHVPRCATHTQALCLQAFSAHVLVHDAKKCTKTYDSHQHDAQQCSTKYGSHQHAVQRPAAYQRWRS